MHVWRRRRRRPSPPGSGILTSIVLRRVTSGASLSNMGRSHHMIGLCVAVAITWVSPLPVLRFGLASRATRSDPSKVDAPIQRAEDGNSSTGRTRQDRKAESGAHTSTAGWVPQWRLTRLGPSTLATTTLQFPVSSEF
ncbi:hypothetical protein GUJ93_ZPchr0002g23902 [Zizania palustris]|uniref:Uncharacterized protein n=1 Tax=Zizania palustris TaxID=103762 RepID=A0A8J5S6C1_ZIZPA|nr:hypothetical protein GUJ93_ZPchr0002g23902 [Zizania palustris]